MSNNKPLIASVILLVASMLTYYYGIVSANQIAREVSLEVLGASAVVVMIALMMKIFD